MKSQIQMFYEAAHRNAQINMAFMDAVEQGLTREELLALIKRRPEIWGRFEKWVKLLPEGGAQ